MQIKLGVFGSGACLGLLLTATAAEALNSAGEGRRIFLRENCYACHGGFGGGGMGPNFRDNRPSEHNVKDAVKDGKRGGMPSFPRLSSDDIKDLTAYIRSLRTAAEPTFTHWWERVPGDLDTSLPRSPFAQ